MNKIISIISLLIFNNIVLFSQTEHLYTFDECVKIGIKNNIELQQQNNNVKIANYTTQESRWNLAPQIDAYDYSNINLARATDQNNNYNSGKSYYMYYNLSASLALFQGLSRVNIISANKFLELSYKETEKQMENKLYLDIAEAFSQALYTKELIKVAEDELALNIQEDERIRSNIEEGKTEEVAGLESKAKISASKLSLQRLRNTYKLSLVKLTQLINYNESAAFDIDGSPLLQDIPMENTYTVDSIYNIACQNLPEIQSLEYQLKSYKKDLSAAKGKLFPTLSVEGGYSSYYYSTDTLSNGKIMPFESQMKNYLNPYVSLTLNIPIFSGFSKQFNIKRKKLQVTNSELELENKKITIKKEIESTLQELNAYQEEYQSALENLDYMNEYFESNKQRYDLGLINTTTFNEAQNKLSEAKASVLSAHYNWIVKEKMIKVYCGEALSPFN